MLNEHPTIIGTSGVSESFPFRPYVYAGTEPYTRPAPRPDAPKCATEGCVSVVYARALCSRHYRQLRVHGVVDAPDKRRKENRDASDGV